MRQFARLVEPLPSCNFVDSSTCMHLIKMSKNGVIHHTARAFRRAATEMLRVLLAIPLLLLLLLVLLQYGTRVFDEIGRQGVQPVMVCAALIVLAFGLLLRALVKRKSAWHPLLFLPCSLVFSAVVYYAYISSIEVAWVSDFLTMWNHAVGLVAADDYTVKSIYDQRALPVLVPLVLLFGPNQAMVPVINLVFLLCIQLLGYDLARRMAGHRVAQGATVLWISAMEPILALPITSHDIWGLFFLVLFFWGFRVTWERVDIGRISTTKAWLALAGCTIGLAMVLALLNMQRSIGPLVLLAFVLASAVMALKGKCEWSLLKAPLLLGLVVFLLYGGINVGLKHGHYLLSSGQRAESTQLRIGVYGSSLSNGIFGQGQILDRVFFDQLDGKARWDLVETVPLSDMALQPIARFGNIIYRAFPQARLGSQDSFYQARARTHASWLIPFTRIYNVYYSVLLAALGLWIVVPLLRRLESFDMLVQLAFLSALVGLMLLAGESQPRYVFPIWFILPQLVGFAILHAESGKGQPTVTSVWGWDMTRGALFLVAMYFACALLLRGTYSEAKGRILSGWHPVLHNVEQPSRDWFRAVQNKSATQIRRRARDRRTAGFGDLALVLKIPADSQVGGSMSAEKLLCTDVDRRALDFFYYMPYQNAKASGVFTLDVLVDGKRKWSAPLPGVSKVAHVYIPNILPPSTCGNLEFRLRTSRALKSPSWIRASRTDVYFARLVR